MTRTEHGMTNIDGPHTSYPYNAVQPTAGATHRAGRVVAVVVVVLLIAVGIIVSL